MQETFEVQVLKDGLVFSCAHFITYAGGLCERLHGHNYRMAVEVGGPLDENHYVFDFIALRDAAAAIAQRLDHHVLLPTQSPHISVAADGPQILARFADRLWSFPAADCVLLPIANTTAELLARWIAGELHHAWSASGQPLPPLTRVRVEENFGQWATCEWRTKI